MNQDLVNQLHQDYCQCRQERQALIDKWLPEPIHKTKLKNAQADKHRWTTLSSNIIAFRHTLAYYGYTVRGPNDTLVKVEQE